MKRKIAVATAVALASALVLAGCSAGGTSAGGDTGASTDGKGKTITLWLVGAGLFVLFAWQMLRWRKHKHSPDSREERAAALGPWPVRPEAVLTRTQLVQAFDYLALLTLGKKVESCAV